MVIIYYVAIYNHFLPSITNQVLEGLWLMNDPIYHSQNHPRGKK